MVVPHHHVPAIVDCQLVFYPAVLTQCLLVDVRALVLCDVVPPFGPHQINDRLKSGVFGCFALDLLDCHGRRDCCRGYGVNVFFRHLLFVTPEDALSGRMPLQVIRWVVVTRLVLDNHLVGM